MSGATLKTTGIGSLPFLDYEEALAHVFARYTLPFYPQLVRVPCAPEHAALAPMLREVLTREQLDALAQGEAKKLMKLLAAAPAGEMFEGWPGMGAFLARSCDVDEAKVQCVGPATAGALIAAALPSVARREIADVAEQWVLALTEAACAVLRARSTARFIFVWDDGMLKGGETVHVFLAKPRDRIRLGVHSCALGSLRALAGAAPGAVLAVDANVVTMDADAEADVILGVVDTRKRRIDKPAALALARTNLKDPRVIALSGGCGTGLHDIDYELTLAQALTEIARQKPQDRVR
jgi:hypothetical protein